MSNPAMPSHALTGHLETIAIVSPHEGGYAQIAELSWARPNNPGDASLYIRPFFGQNWTAKAWAGDFEPDATTEVSAQRHIASPAAFREPKLSLHHTGQTHAYIGPGISNRVGPVHGSRLDDPAGGHVATIAAFDLAGLPLLQRPLSALAPAIDFLIPAPADGRFNITLYTGTDEERMRERYPTVPFLLRFDRVNMPTPLFIAVRCVPVPDDQQVSPGVLVVGGWGPGAAQDEPVSAVAVWVGPDEQLQ